MFYGVGFFTLGSLRDIFYALDRSDVPSFRAFGDNSMKTTRSIEQKVEVGFMNMLRLMETEDGANRGTMRARYMKREYGFVARVRKCFYPRPSGHAA